MNKNWRYFLILAYPLLAVNAIIALLYAVFWCRAHSWAWREGVLTFVAGTKNGWGRMIGRPDGQGWSWIVGYRSAGVREYADLRVHENTHVAQEIAWAYVGAVVAMPVLLGGHPIAALITALSGGPMFALTYGASFLRHYIPSVRYWYNVMRPDAPRWIAAGFALRQWYAPYTMIVYEEHANAAQDTYTNDTSPIDRTRVWGHA